MGKIFKSLPFRLLLGVVIGILVGLKANLTIMHVVVTLNYIDAGFQSIRIAKFRAPVCQYVFKQRKEPEGIKALL